MCEYTHVCMYVYIDAHARTDGHINAQNKYIHIYRERESEGKRNEGRDKDSARYIHRGLRMCMKVWLCMLKHTHMTLCIRGAACRDNRGRTNGVIP